MMCSLLPLQHQNAKLSNAFYEHYAGCTCEGVNTLLSLALSDMLDSILTTHLMHVICHS